MGSLEVLAEGRVVALAGAKQRSVLAILALEANRVVATDLLLDQIWGESAGDGARRSLQVYVSNLRRALGEEARIESQSGGYALRIDPEQLDLHRFTRLVEAGRAGLAEGNIELGASLLREALDLWRGPPLADLAYAVFAREHVERLQQERLAVLEDRIDADLALGRHVQVAPELVDLVTDNPLRERLRAQLMIALYRCGRQADALNAYKSGRELLVDQLGVEPASELQDLERAILDHDESLDAPPHVQLPVRATVASQPSRSSATSITSSNLPAQVTSFVGRVRELDEIRTLLASTRTVTLTGPGGSGKTRLALQVAGEMSRDFADGVWLAELAPLTDPALVTATLAAAVGARDEVGRATTEVLVDALRDRSVLVAIDNCEHVIDSVAKVADALMRSCPTVRLLTTSREPLGIAGERVFRVPTLDVPDSDTGDLNAFLASDAVRLFAERVALHKADFAVDSANVLPIARVCRRLDGIPLAIELAAARLRSLSLAELEARLDQRFLLLTGGVRTALPRQQTLQALIDWSWGLLTDAEQTVLARLAVFAGSWDLDAAEAVVSGAGIELWEVLDLLAALVDKSLVQLDDTAAIARYRLLETVRDYANAKVTDGRHSKPGAIKARHRDHFLALAEEAAPHLTAHGQNGWLDRLERDHENLRAALKHCLGDSDPEPGLRLAVALQWLWQFRGPAGEGAEILNELLAKPDAQGPTRLRGRALAVLAALSIESGNTPAGSACAEEVLAIAQELDDKHLEAEALSVMSWTCFRLGAAADSLRITEQGLVAARLTGDVELITRLLNARGVALGLNGDPAAIACYQEARDLCRLAGNQIRVAVLLNNLGYFELAAGDVTAARVDLSEGLAIALAANEMTIMNTMLNLGLVEYVSGAHSVAHELFVRGLATARRAGDKNQTAYMLFGVALTTTGDAEHAAAIHGAADALLDLLGESYELVEANLRDADHKRLREALGVEAFTTAYQSGRNFPRDEVVARVLESSGKLRA